jgi:hypothetical protein
LRLEENGVNTRRISVLLILSAVLMARSHDWVKMGETALGAAYYDCNSLQYKSHDYASLWVKIDIKDGDTMTAHWQFHRPTRRMRVLAGITSGQDGRVLHSTTEPDEWREVIPGSLVERAFYVLFPERK